MKNPHPLTRIKVIALLNPLQTRPTLQRELVENGCTFRRAATVTREREDMKSQPCTSQDMSTQDDFLYFSPFPLLEPFAPE